MKTYIILYTLGGNVVHQAYRVAKSAGDAYGQIYEAFSQRNNLFIDLVQPFDSGAVA